MSYDYNVKNTDGGFAFIKRMLLYVAIMVTTIGFALTILFVLFELYLWLILSLGMMIFAVGGMLLLGRKVSLFRYLLTPETLIVTAVGGKEYRFAVSEFSFERNAEKSDFISRDIIVLTFPKGVIITKNAVNQDTSEGVSCLVRYHDRKYLLMLDDYARSLLFGEKNEDTLL